MLIIKLGGSVFAPKNNTKFDLEYLKKLNSKLKKIYKGQIILVHGAGNIGHGFVKKYGINSETFKIYLKIREKFFSQMDKIFDGYKRILAKNFLKLSENKKKFSENLIIGGDILDKSLKIISSDVLFGLFLKNKNSIKIILTDVDGVFDENGKVIEKLDLKDINKIKFWQKENDVTNSMKGKLFALKKYLPKNGDGLWLCNGFDLDNIEKIIKYKKGNGTFIY